MVFARPLVAFLFNWIGFCLSFCLTNTIAGRYGAICGFGLSLIKWILIVRVGFRLFRFFFKYYLFIFLYFCSKSDCICFFFSFLLQFSDYFTGYFNGQYWLWWIFLLLGG